MGVSLRIGLADLHRDSLDHRPEQRLGTVQSRAVMAVLTPRVARSRRSRDRTQPAASNEALAGCWP